MLLTGAAAAGVGFVLWKWGTAAPVIAARWVMNTFNRGNKLSDSTLVDGVVQEIPEVLADMAAGVLGFYPDRDTLALARMGRSEGVDGMEYRMHVLINDWRDLNGRYPSTYPTIESVLTHSKNSRADGHFSTQALGKRFSSSKDPFEGDYALAQKVMADNAAGIDPTNGATKFVDKSGPFYVDGEKTDYAGIVAAWGADGYQPVDNLPGATDNFVIFVKG